MCKNVASAGHVVRSRHGRKISQDVFRGFRLTSTFNKKKLLAIIIITKCVVGYTGLARYKDGLRGLMILHAAKRFFGDRKDVRRKLAQRMTNVGVHHFLAVESRNILIRIHWARRKQQ